MKRELRHFLLVLCFSTGITVMMDPKEQSEGMDESADDDSGDFQSVLGACLAKKVNGLFECVNRGTLSVLQMLNSEDVLDFASVKLERAEGQSRDLLDLDYDPKDFGNVVQAAARLMERRNLKWELGGIYPGLQMRVGPMLNGNGVLEFVVDERFNGYGNRQLGTGRLLVRNLVLPFLLGFKFSLASLVPLIFGVILLVTKKALFLTKIALLLSGILGWNSIVTGGHPVNFPTTHLHPFEQPNFHEYPNFHGHDVIGPGLGHFGHHDHRYPVRPVYRSIQKSSDFPSYSQHTVKEVVNIYEKDKGSMDRDASGSGKNFVWTA